MCDNPLFVREIDTLINRLTFANTSIRSRQNTAIAILNFDCEGNVSTFSPELLTMTDPHYGDFTFGNVFDGTLEELLMCQKLVDIHALIQKGVSKCKQACHTNLHPKREFSPVGTGHSPVRACLPRTFGRATTDRGMPCPYECLLCSQMGITNQALLNKAAARPLQYPLPHRPLMGRYFGERDRPT
jgi:hypothetical protein